MKNKIMKCGCVANSRIDLGNGNIVIGCGIHSPGDGLIDSPEPDLTGRIARCCYGQHGKVASHLGLAFFSHKPNEPLDTYYCGCYGWD